MIGTWHFLKGSPEYVPLLIIIRGVTLCFRNSGQSCNSPTRMLVPQKFMNDAAAIAKVTADGMSVGDPVSDDTLIGPVVSERQWNAIQEHIGKGIKEGATLVTGGPGRPDELPKGYYIRPTIFSNVTQNMTIAQEEIFGPVLSIMAYKDEDDAVNIANNTPYGLAAYVESKDQLRARSIAHRIRAGQYLHRHHPWYLHAYTHSYHNLVRCV